jgi:signal transduction histidine kinase
MQEPGPIWWRFWFPAVAFPAFCIAGFAQGGAETNAPTLLTNAQQLVALGTNIPPGRYQAQLQAVVIYVSSPRRVYAQDGEHGLQVNLSGTNEPIRVGDKIDVTGTPVGSDPVLRLDGAKARVLGDAPLPETKLISAHRLVRGDEPFRYVALRGRVRDMVSGRGGINLLLTDHAFPFTVTLQAPPTELPRDWLDGEIEVRGFSVPSFREGRASGFRFWGNSTNDVSVISTGIPQPFEGRPLLTIAEAAKVPQEWVHRIRVSGTVLLHRGTFVFFDDGTGAMVAELLRLLPVPADAQDLGHDPQGLLHPGDRIEMIGMRRNWFSLSPTILLAEYRKIGTAPLPEPVKTSLPELRAGRHAGRRVTLTAKLIDQRTWATASLWNYQEMVFQVDNDVFHARWESDQLATWQLKTDSYYRITGVNAAEHGHARGRNTLQIFPNSPADVVLASAPPLWMRAEARRIGLAAGGVGFLAGAWILLQRVQMRRLERRVTERTAELRAEVTAREAAQGELRIALVAEKELNQLKSSFVSMVSHEFRTPLEVILSSSNILDRYLERLPPEKRKAQLKSIRKSVGRMNDLIEDVLLLGKFDAAGMACHPTPVNVASFCSRIVAEIESAVSRSGAIQLQVESFDAEAQADEGLLHHILSNLLSNALKYSPPLSPVDLTVTRDGLNACFVIRDRGRGIPAADQTRLFTAFYRGGNVGQTQGSGLGLVIVKRCVDLHRGTIACESAEGDGATFTVSLPLFDGTRFFRRRDTETPENGNPSTPIDGKSSESNSFAVAQSAASQNP